MDRFYVRRAGIEAGGTDRPFTLTDKRIHSPAIGPLKSWPTDRSRLRLSNRMAYANLSQRVLTLAMGAGVPCGCNSTTSRTSTHAIPARTGQAMTYRAMQINMARNRRWQPPSRS